MTSLTIVVDAYAGPTMAQLVSREPFSLFHHSALRSSSDKAYIFPS